MLKALDDLEKAVGRLVEKSRSRAEDSPLTRSAAAPGDNTVTMLETAQAGPGNEEAAELIRRAIKRLKSL
jgi:hypothetical protein